MKDDLPYKIELWMDPEMSAREETLAATSKMEIARAAYDLARRMYPKRLVTLSNRAMLMRRSDREAPPGTIPLFPQTDD